MSTEKKTAPRWTVIVNGESAGGSFASEAEAEKAARLIRQSSGPEDDVQVVPKRPWLADASSRDKDGKPPKK